MCDRQTDGIAVAITALCESISALCIRVLDGSFQVQLEEDGGDSTGQSWMETSCLAYAPPGVTRHKSSQVRVYVIVMHFPVQVFHQFPWSQLLPSLQQQSVSHQLLQQVLLLVPVLLLLDLQKSHRNRSCRNKVNGLFLVY